MNYPSHIGERLEARFRLFYVVRHIDIRVLAYQPVDKDSAVVVWLLVCKVAPLQLFKSIRRSCQHIWLSRAAH